MEEKVYRSMGVIGACNLAVGIILIVVGVACGILSIIGGARFRTGTAAAGRCGSTTIIWNCSVRSGDFGRIGSNWDFWPLPIWREMY